MIGIGRSTNAVLKFQKLDADCHDTDEGFADYNQIALQLGTGIACDLEEDLNTFSGLVQHTEQKLNIYQGFIPVLISMNKSQNAEVIAGYHCMIGTIKDRVFKLADPGRRRQPI